MSGKKAPRKAGAVVEQIVVDGTVIGVVVNPKKAQSERSKK